MMRRYRARFRLHIVPLDVTVKAGDLVEFDGTTVKVNGQEATCPALEKALHDDPCEGWESIAEHFFGKWFEEPWLIAEDELVDAGAL
jgi:hypothetical protein